MSKWLILLTMLCTGAPLLAAPAWTWVDANGQQHYSDRPVPGAQRIDLPDAQGFSRNTPARTRTQPVEAPQIQATQAYRVFNVISPSQQETLWNIGGNLNVQVNLTPSLQTGHRFDAYLDGQLITLNAAGPQFTIPDVVRGLHTLQVLVVDANGSEVLRSLAVTFMVQQTSVQNPNNPNRPGG